MSCYILRVVIYYKKKKIMLTEIHWRLAKHKRQRKEKNSQYRRHPQFDITNSNKTA